VSAFVQHSCTLSGLVVNSGSKPYLHDHTSTRASTPATLDCLLTTETNVFTFYCAVCQYTLQTTTMLTLNNNSTHREEGMVDVRSRRCQFQGCMHQPSYGLEGHRAQFCRCVRSSAVHYTQRCHSLLLLLTLYDATYLTMMRQVESMFQLLTLV
jgi:hypothetical protein